LAVVLALALTTTGCGLLGRSSTADQSGSLEKIKVRGLRAVDIVPLKLAMSQGFMAAEGLDVDLQYGTKGSENVNNVIGGSADIGLSSYPPAISAHAKAKKMKVVWDASQTTSAEGREFVLLMVKGDGAIRDIHDLKGKKVASSSPGGISEMAMASQLRSNGMDPKDVSYVNAQFVDMPPMIKAGQVDAAIIQEPYVQVAYQAGMTKLLDPFTGATNDFPWSGYMTTEDWARQPGNRQKIEKFQRAMRKATDFAAGHTPEVQFVIVHELKVDPAIAPLVQEPLHPISIDPVRLQRVVDLMVANGEKGPDGQPLKVDIHTMLLDPA
jgi:NitT/TauT family transport system substrate-binding protein